MRRSTRNAERKHFRQTFANIFNIRSFSDLVLFTVTPLIAEQKELKHPPVWVNFVKKRSVFWVKNHIFKLFSMVLQASDTTRECAAKFACSSNEKQN